MGPSTAATALPHIEARKAPEAYRGKVQIRWHFKRHEISYKSETLPLIRSYHFPYSIDDAGVVVRLAKEFSVNWQQFIAQLPMP